MFFNGGLLPTYYLIRSLNLINNVLVMIVPIAMSAFNVVLFRTFFNSHPVELRESASLDGAGHFKTLLFIILPISKALLATFALFGMVQRWNDYIQALLYLNDPDKMPIQIMLRTMLVQMDFRGIEDIDRLRAGVVAPRSLRSAMIIITILPIMCVYPFLQKHFTKGIMVGSLKS